MKLYCDLLIKPVNFEEFKRIVEKEIILGYKVIGIEKNPLIEDMKKFCKEKNIFLITRTNYLENKKESLINYIHEEKKETLKIIKRYPIKIITIPIKNIKNVDIELINFISQKKLYFEFLYSEFLNFNIIFEKEIINRFKNIIKYILRKNFNIIISSGATNEKYLRGKRDVIGFIKSLSLEKYEVERVLKIDLDNLW